MLEQAWEIATYTAELAFYFVVAVLAIAAVVLAFVGVIGLLALGIGTMLDRAQDQRR